MGQIDIWVVRNQAGGNPCVIRACTPRAVKMMDAIIPTKAHNLQTEYPLQGTAKFEMMHIIERDNLEVYGDLHNDYEYVSETEKAEAAKRDSAMVSNIPLQPEEYPSEWGAERRNFEDNYRYMMEKRDEFPFIVTCANLEQRPCLLYPQKMVELKGGDGMYGDRVFICIRCREVMTEEYVHMMIGEMKPIFCEK